MRLSWTTAPISSMQQANLFLATGVAKSLTTTAWLRCRFRMYIWKQWKKPKTKVANLRKLGIPADKAYQSGLAPLQTKSSHRRDILTSQLITSLFVKCTYAVEQSCTGRYARWCVGWQAYCSLASYPIAVKITEWRQRIISARGIEINKKYLFHFWKR